MPSAPHPNLLSYLGTHPELAGPPRHVGANSAVVGRVTLNVEKAINSLTLGCNQKTARDPVMALGDAQVLRFCAASRERSSGSWRCGR